MILVRKLLTGDNRRPRVRRVTFEEDELVDSVVRRFWFLMGVGAGSVAMRCYSRFLEEIYSFSGDSNMKLFMGMLAWSGADAYVGPILTIFMDEEGRSAGFSLLMWIVFALALSTSMRSFGPCYTINLLILDYGVIQSYRAELRFQEYTEGCKHPAVAMKLRRDREFYEETSAKMSYLFGRLGAALGGCLQMFLPLKYTCSGFVLFATYRLDMKLRWRR